MDFSILDSAREEYESAQDAADAKRETYHAAIRRLYMSGTSLRELADHLGLSHQRIHKIVGLEPPKRKRRRTHVIASILAVILGIIGGVLSLAVGVLAGPDLRYRNIFVTVEKSNTQMISQISETLRSDPGVATWSLIPESRRPISQAQPTARTFHVQSRSPVDGYRLSRRYSSWLGVHVQEEDERPLGATRLTAWYLGILLLAGSIVTANKLRKPS